VPPLPHHGGRERPFRLIISVFNHTSSRRAAAQEEDASWKLLRPMGLSVMMDFFAEKTPVVTEAPKASDTAAHEDDDEVVAMIKELIEERIR
jgi:hypothetical protein